MFVYQMSSKSVSPEVAERQKIEGYFNIPERWADRMTQHTMILVLAALMFGGISKMTTSIPVAAFVGSIFVLAYFLGDRTTAGEPRWVNQLSSASLGLLYLGLGHCLGGVVFLALPVLARTARELSGL